ncbi:Gfo/Idh/MocA family oxidoreductase [Chloroflexi bacterium TSY]|nr:Gfo/Idh/MocA family oxidoreductase [Chloroflexi bacterium TSY]
MSKAVVMGCGGRTPAHIEAYQYIDNAEVIACSARTDERRQAVAEKYGLHGYTDLVAMLEAESPDIVHLVIPPSARVEPMRLVSEVGVPICTVEKPIATRVQDWHQLQTLEASSQTKFGICHQFRWQPHMMKCQNALKSGKLGDIKFLDFSAGMNISGQGTHILNYAMSMNGDSPVVRVFGAASGTEQSDTVHPAPDSTIGYLTFENGVRALWNNGPTALRTGDPNTMWQHVRVAAYADKGRINYEEFGAWEIVGPDGVEGGDFGDSAEWMHNNILAQASFHKAMIEWHEGGAPCGTNLKQSLHEWAVVLALYQSAMERRPIEMADFDPPKNLFDQLLNNLR